MDAILAAQAALTEAGINHDLASSCISEGSLPLGLLREGEPDLEWGPAYPRSTSNRPGSPTIWVAPVGDIVIARPTHLDLDQAMRAEIACRILGTPSPVDPGCTPIDDLAAYDLAHEPQGLREAAIQIAIALRWDEWSALSAAEQQIVQADLDEWVARQKIRLSTSIISHAGRIWALPHSTAPEPTPAKLVSSLLSSSLLALDQLMGSRRTVPHRIWRVLQGEPYPQHIRPPKISSSEG